MWSRPFRGGIVVEPGAISGPFGKTTRDFGFSEREANAMAGNVVELTDANWSSEVLQSSVPVVVDFWAPWCGPCRMLAPTIEKLAGDFQGKVKIGKLNTDQNQDTAGGLRISAIPTVLFFNGGKEVERLVGVNSEAKFKDALAKLGVS
jgi:thioredoxin 1